MYKAIVFDLDGTLLDTLEDLADAVNAALRSFSLPTRSLDEVREFVGNGAANLIARAAGEENAERHAEILQAFREYYAVHCADKTKPYDGVLSLLAGLKSRGVKTAVLSNKPDSAVKALAIEYFPNLLCEVAGENERAGIKRKPAPDALFAVMERLGVNERETLYVGDSDVDVQTAKNAGVDCVAVTWGFRDETFLAKHGATKFVRSPLEILEYYKDGIGYTPLVRLLAIEKKYGLQVKLYAKDESVNKGGSVKDRVAREMLDDAERSNRLQTGGTVIEPTSGNTGIGLALVAKQRGYKAVIVMPDTMSVERREMIRSYGAQVVLTDGAKGMQGAVEKAEELLSQTPNAMIAGQFDNPANPMAHYKTTAPEISVALDGRVDVVVAGVGTGGTITGIGRYFKENNPQTRIVAVEPFSSPLLSKGVAGKHGIQGIGANFIPSVLDRKVIDEIVCVTDEQAIECMQEINQTEGLFVGISAGAAVYAATQIAKRDEYCDKTIVVILPDNANRYKSLMK
jgi:cysteine synthase A